MGAAPATGAAPIIVLVAQWIERFLAEEEVTGSNPVEDTRILSK